MPALALQKLVQLRGVAHYVVDVVTLTPPAGQGAAWRWYVLRGAGQPQDLLVEEHGVTLRLLSPLEMTAPTEGFRPVSVDVHSSTGRRSEFDGRATYDHLPDRGLVRLGERVYDVQAARLGAGDVLHEVIPGPDRAEDHTDAGVMRAADWTLALLVPGAGLVSFFLRRFDFTLTFLGFAALMLLFCHFLEPQGFRRWRQVVGASFVLTLSAWPFLFFLRAAPRDHALLCFSTQVLALSLLESQPLLVGRIADGAWWMLRAALLPGLAILVWALGDEDWSWLLDWRTFYGYGSLLFPLVFVLTWSLSGRAFLQSLGRRWKR